MLALAPHIQFWVFAIIAAMTYTAFGDELRHLTWIHMMGITPLLLVDLVQLRIRGPDYLDFFGEGGFRWYQGSMFGSMLALGGAVDVLFRGYTQDPVVRDVAGTVAHALLAFVCLGLFEPIRQNRQEIAPCVDRLLWYDPAVVCPAYNKAPDNPCAPRWDEIPIPWDLLRARAYLLAVQSAIFVAIVFAVLTGLERGCGFDYWALNDTIAPGSIFGSMCRVYVAFLFGCPLWDLAETLCVITHKSMFRLWVESQPIGFVDKELWARKLASESEAVEAYELEMKRSPQGRTARFGGLSTGARPTTGSRLW